jgi:quercetin dioxygenase-like cupin family protein
MALAEQDLIVRHVAESDAPWVDTGIGIDLKVMRVDLKRGTWAIRNRFVPGVQIPTHRHTGPVEGYTLTGRWHYLEYDFVSTAGSYIHEPAGSVHTLHVPEDNTEPTDVLFVIEGALINLTPDGQLESITDAPSILEAYLMLCDAAGIARPAGLIVD